MINPNKDFKNSVYLKFLIKLTKSSKLKLSCWKHPLLKIEYDVKHQKRHKYFLDKFHESREE